MIAAADLHVDLAGHAALTGVSFSAEPGEHIALVGPNGAGKSTLLRTLAGLIVPARGSVHLRDKPLMDWQLTERARHMSYLPQERALAWDLSVEDVAALGRFAWGAQRYEALSEEGRRAVLSALTLAGAEPLMGRSVKTLSGGEQARVHLARALAGDADVLLLDEPCAALDMRHQLHVMQVLDAQRARGKTVITVLHDLRLAERFATRLIVLSGGALAYDAAIGDGVPDDILASVFRLAREPSSGFVRR